MLDLLKQIIKTGSHEIMNSESLTALKTIPNETFDLILSSPPYNVGKEYEAKTSIEKYLETQEEIVDELVRTLSEQGNLCWQVGNYVDHGEIYPLDIFYYHIFKKHGLRLRNRIIWHFGHGLHASNRFSGRYETLLWFSKSDSYIFNLDNVRIPSKYPGKLHFKGPKRGMPSGNPLGKNPSDIWEVLERDWESGLWNIPNVKNNHPEKTSHPCQFPIELVERCILALSNEGSWVLDPFAGVCSTVVGAIMHNRNAIGIERDAEYCEMAESRIRDLKAGNLKTRPMTQAIYSPSPNDKISKVPQEWVDQNELFEKSSQRILFSNNENSSKVLPSER